MPTVDAGLIKEEVRKDIKSSFGGSESNSANFFFWIVLVLHAIDLFVFKFKRDEMLPVFVGVYLLVAFASLKVYKTESPLRQLAFSLGVSALAVGMPYIRTAIVNWVGSSSPIAPVINTLSIFAGAWPMYAAFFKGELLSGGTGSFANIYFWGWLFFIMALMLYSYYDMYSTASKTEALDAGAIISNLLKLIWELLKSGMAYVPTIFQGIVQVQKDAYKEATSDYIYTGEVEQNQNEKIGVYLENIKEADPVNYEDEPITLWATLTAKTYESDSGEDDPIEISNVLCKADRGKTSEVLGVIKPKSSFKVYAYDEQDLDCVFEKDPATSKSLSYGSHVISFEADFNFMTKAYRKAYFAEYDFIRNLNREGIDLFQQYNLEKNPIAKYTNGPIAIGIEVDDVVAISDTTDRTPTLGFSLSNRWDGELRQINQVNVYVPQGIEIDQKSCNKEFLATDSANGYTVYSLANPISYQESINNVAQSFRCHLDVKNKEELLENSPIATRYITVEAKYHYELRKSKTINVRKTTQT